MSNLDLSAYLSAARESREAVDRAGVAAFKAAAEADPAVFRQQRAIAGRLGLSIETVQTDPDGVARIERERMLEDATARAVDVARYPHLAGMTRNYEFAAASQDDFDALRNLETWTGWLSENWQQGGAVNELGWIYARLAAGLQQPGDEARAKQLKQRQQLVAQAVAGGKTSLTGQFFGSAAELAGQWFDTTVGALVAGAGGGLVGNLAGPAGAATGFAKTAATAFFAQSAIVEGGNAYAEYLDAGYDPEIARNMAFAVGLINAVGETYGAKVLGAPAKKFVRNLAGKAASSAVTSQTASAAWASFAKQYSKQILAETGTEMMQELVTFVGGDLARSYTAPQLKSKLSTEEGREELFTRILDVAVKTMQGTALLGLPGTTANLFVESKRAQSAQTTKTFLSAVAAGASASKLKAEAPDLFRQFAGQITEDSPAPEVFVDRATLRQVLQQVDAARVDPTEETATETLRREAPEVLQQLEAETGGDAVIPTAVFMKISDTKFGNALMPHMRLDQSAPSEAEAQAYGKLLETYGEGAKDLLENSKQVREEFKQVREEELKRLRAVGARPDEELRVQALMLASFVAVTASKTKNAAGKLMTPMEFYNTHGKVVTTAGEAIGSRLNQFAGVRARTAPLDQLQIAKAMEVEGDDEDTIRKATGWQRGVDGDWRWEIDDSASSWDFTPAAAGMKDATPENTAKRAKITAGTPVGEMMTRLGVKPVQINSRTWDITGPTVRLGDILKHDTLFAAYPGLADLRVGLLPSTVPDASAAYVHDKGLVLLGPSLQLEEARAAIMHELQHAIQELEGFARGGNPKNLPEALLRKAAMQLQREQFRLFLALLAPERAEAAMALAAKPYRQWTDADLATVSGPVTTEEYRYGKENRTDSPEMEGEMLGGAIARKIRDLQRAAESDGETLTIDDRVRQRAYFLLAGEAEARNTETRLNLSAGARQEVSARETEDVPADQQIVRRGVTWGKARLSTTAFDKARETLRQGSTDDDSIARHNLVVARQERQVAAKVRLSAEEKARIKEVAAENDLSAKEVEAVVRGQKARFPVEGGWAPMTFKGLEVKRKTKEGKEVVTWEPTYEVLPYEFARGPDNKILKKPTGAPPTTPKGAKAYQKAAKAYHDRTAALASRLVDEVRALFSRAKPKVSTSTYDLVAGETAAQRILSQATWYREMRSALRRDFGGLGDLFADLLGAASPNTPVRENWIYASEVLGRATAGDFDAMLPQWVAWSDEINRQEAILLGWFRDQRKQGKTKKAIKESDEYKERYERLKAARELPDELIPRKANGAKYGFNGRNLVRAMVGLWRVVKKSNPDIGRGETAPKALNFSGNLIGFRSRATIDVWAARLLQRLAGKWRIPPLAEDGVDGAMLRSGETTQSFGFGQDVFALASEAIRNDPELAQHPLLKIVNDDDLQAIVWFLEKEVWTVNNWTSTAGEGGSFEFEAAIEGQPDRDALKKWRKIADSSKSTPQKREEALAKIDALKQRVTRYQGMISQETLPGWQGEGHVPTDYEQLELQNELLTAVKESDPTARVVANKIESTLGMYGSSAERAIDLEVVARAGYDATKLWLAMLRAALNKRQDSVGLSRVLQQTEEVDMTRHRPGVEIYFKTARDRAFAEMIRDKLAAKGIGALTIITDARPLQSTGAMPPVVGVRFQFVPEMDERWGGQLAGMTDEQLAALVAAKAAELQDIARDIAREVPDVTFAEQLWYDTRVAFNGDYQRQIDEILAAGTEGTGAGAAPRQVWAGRSIRDGVAEASRRREAAAADAVAERPAGEQPADGEVRGDELPDAGADRETLRQNEPEESGPRGEYAPATPSLPAEIRLTPNADASTWFHEMAHHFLAVYEQVSASPEASPEIRADFLRLLQWFGVSEAEWRAMTLDQKRKHHEAFAYNFELWLFEGKAPARTLAPMFKRFREWIGHVYRSLVSESLRAAYRKETGAELPQLSDEVRQVMGRMLAAEETAKVALSVHSAVALFQTKEEFIAAGGTEDRWQELQDLRAKADDAAVDELDKRSVGNMKWGRNARSRILKRLQAEAAEAREGLREAAQATISELPVYRALRWIKGNQKAGEEPHRLHRGTTLPLVPKGTSTDAVSTWVKDDGVDPDTAAKMFGFENGAELVQALLAAPPFEEAVETHLDERMLEEHGDLLDQRQLDAAVDAALHTEMRLRMVAAEAAALEKSTAPLRVMLAAAKLAAERALGAQRVSSITRRQHRDAAMRAGREAWVAFKEGRVQDALIAKRRQLQHEALAQAAVAARQEIDKTLDKFKALTRPDKAIAKTHVMPLIAAARAILAAFGVAGTDAQRAALRERSSEFLTQLREYDPPMADRVADLIADATGGVAKDYSQLTLDEFRAMAQTVSALMFSARRHKQIEIDGKKAELDDVVLELVERLKPLAPPAGRTQGVQPKELRALSLQGLRSAATRAEHAFTALDRSDDGPFTRFIYRPIQKAIDAYRIKRNEFVDAYVKLVEKLDLPPGTVAAPEIGWTFNSKAELIGALLHAGNKSNLAKLLVGYAKIGGKWTDLETAFSSDGQLNTANWDAFLAAAQEDGRITEADWQFVQAVWDLNEKMKPLAQKAHMALYGTYFDEVKASPVQTKWGQLRGGYVPAKVDPHLAPDAAIHRSIEALEQDFRNTVPSTGMGFTMRRIENYRNPLDLDLRRGARHIDEVIRFAYVQPAVRDALRVIKDPRLVGALGAVDSAAITGWILPWLTRVARMSNGTPGMDPTVDSFWRAVRTRTGLATMFANISNAMQQITGWFPAMLKVRGSYLRGALWRYMSNRKQVVAEVVALSPFMAQRMSTQTYDLAETLDELVTNPSRFQKLQGWSKQHGYFLQQAFQNTVDVTTWVGAYEQALAQLKDMPPEAAQAEAIARADAAVRLTQGGTTPETISRFEAGTPFAKLFTQFQGYFGMLANLNAAEFAKTVRELGWTRQAAPALFWTFLLGFAAPMMVAEAISRTFRGEWDDEDDDGYLDEFGSWALSSLGGGAVAMLPFGGTALMPMFNAWNNKPYDDRMMSSPTLSALENAFTGVPRLAMALFDDTKDVTGKNVRDVLTLLTLVTGVPLSVLGRPAGYLTDVARGQVVPYGAADAARGALTGAAAEGTRQR